jgi:macrolide transport system ATP-binding/permease protein
MRMSTLRAWLVRLSGPFNKERRDHDLAAELESHLQMHVEDNLRAGMTPHEARRQALLKLGGVEQTKESYRDRRGLPWLESLLQFASAFACCERIPDSPPSPFSRSPSASARPQ